MTDVRHLDIVPGKTDKEKAEEYRTKILSALEPLTDVLSAARKDGFLVNFNIGTSDLGVSTVQSIVAMKQFC